MAWFSMRRVIIFGMSEQHAKAAASSPLEFDARPSVQPNHSVMDLLHDEVTAWVILAVSLVLTVLGWYIASEYVAKRASERFTFEVEEAQFAIAKRMQEYEQVLRGGVGLFNANNAITRREWRTYVDTLQIEKYWPGIQGIGFSQWINARQKDAWIARVRAEGYPDFDIVPPGKREVYTSIVYLEPLTGRNLRAFGFDMFSEPTRRAAMERARDSGTTAVSGRVTLVQETNKGVQAGFLMYLPVYRAGMPSASLEDRRAALLGFVYSPFRANDLLEGILAHGTPNLHFRIYDGTDLITERLIYDNTGDSEPDESRNPAQFKAVKTVELPGRAWTVSFKSTAQFDLDMASDQPLLVATAGAVVDLLLFAIIVSLARQKRGVEQLTIQARQTMTRSEARLRHVIEAMPGAMFMVDADGKMQLVNARVKELFGYEADELLGQSIEILVPGRFRGTHAGHTQRFLSAPSQRKMGAGRELYARRKDGSEIPVDIQLNTIQSGDEKFVLALAVDVSERQKVKDDIAAERSYLRSVLDSLSEGVVISNEHGTVVYFNEALRQLHGLAEAPIPVERWPEYYSLFLPDGKTPVPVDQLPLHRAGRGEIVQSMEMIIAPRNQPPRNVVVSARPIMLENGARKGAVAAVHDITARKRSEIDLRDAKTAAERANRAKTQFLSHMSHELRTPLNSILGFAQLLVMDQSLDQRYKAGVSKIQSAGEHLLSLISDTLDMSRIESGNLRIESRPTNALSILRECDALAQPLARKYGVTLSMHEGPAARYEVDVDPTRIKQALLNLISNGVKYNHRGGTVWVRCDAARNDRLRFSVRDNGSGISDDKQKLLFQPFNRLGHERGEIEGTGIGLVITRGLVELMGGTLSFTSRAGEGSEFTIEFAARADVEFMDAPVSTAARDAQQLTTTQCAFDCLYVEDNPANIELVDVLFKGYWPHGKLHTAPSAELGLELAALHQPHIILMDIYLPGMDGYAALAHLRALPELRDTPVIALSASASDADVRRGISAGFTEYLTKPIHVPTMLATVERVLDALVKARRVRVVAAAKPCVAPPETRLPEPAPAVAATPEPAVLDPVMTQQLTSYLGERAVPFIDALLFDLPRLLDSMRRAADVGDFEAIRRDAHTIRGTSSNVGATELVNLCAKISGECKSARKDEVQRFLTALHAEFKDRVAPAIAQLRKQLSIHARAV